MAAAGAVPLVLGGDHSIALPDATGVARHLGYGKVSMIHFDAHADTGDIEFGSLYGHGQPMRRLIESGALRGDRFLQMGLRGYWPGPETLDWMAAAADAVLRDDRDRQARARGLPRRGLRDRAGRVRRGLPLRRHRRVRPGPRTRHRHPRAGRAQLAPAARRRTPDLPRAAGGRHRRRRGVTALRPCRDHGVPREPGVPRGALGSRCAQGTACATTPPARCWTAADDGHLADPEPRSSGAAASSTGTGTCPATAWSSTATGCVRCCPRPTWPTRWGPAPRSSTWPAGWSCPGFVDAHVHPVQGGLERIRCDLSEAGTREEYLRLIGEYAAAHPELPWIRGGGWAMSAFPGGNPTAADLDTVVPDRPVFLPNRDHHGAWVNTRALEVAGIGAHTSDPPDGRIERDADGRPTGSLHEGAMALVARHMPPTEEQEYYRGAARRAVLPALPRRHRLAGRHPRCVRRHGRRVRGLPTGGPQRRPRQRRRRRALVGPRPRRRAGRGPARAPGGVRPRPVPGDRRSRSCRTGWPRTARRRWPSPTSTAAGTPPTTPGTRSSSPSCCGRAWPGCTPRASRSTCTRSATAP